MYCGGKPSLVLPDPLCPGAYWLWSLIDKRLGVQGLAMRDEGKPTAWPYSDINQVSYSMASTLICLPGMHDAFSY